MSVLISATVYKLILSLPTVSKVFGLVPQFSHMAAVPPLRKITPVYPKSKTNPLQAWTDPEGSRSLRLPGFKISAHEGGKVVSPTHRPPLTPPSRIYSWYSFHLEADSTPVP